MAGNVPRVAQGSPFPTKPHCTGLSCSGQLGGGFPQAEIPFPPHSVPWECWGKIFSPVPSLALQQTLPAAPFSQCQALA